jgi:hypothetical protein
MDHSGSSDRLLKRPDILQSPQVSKFREFSNTNLTLVFRKDVITLFDVYCEVNGKQDEPQITYNYPSDFNDETIFNSIRRFTFPCGKAVDEDR